jgi:hypothetical protein
MEFNERVADIEKLKKDPNYALLWCRHGNWLLEQAEKVEQLENENELLKRRCVSNCIQY